MFRKKGKGKRKEEKKPCPSIFGEQTYKLTWQSKDCLVFFLYNVERSTKAPTNAHQQPIGG